MTVRFNSPSERLLTPRYGTAEEYHRSGFEEVPSIIANNDIVVLSADYRTVGDVFRARALAQTICAIGTRRSAGDTVTAGTAAGDEISLTVDDTAGLVLGFVIHWSVDQQISQPFVVTVETTSASEDCDRNLSVRFCGNGGIIYVPFASRPSNADRASLKIARQVRTAVQADGVVKLNNIPAGLQGDLSASFGLMMADGEHLEQWLEATGAFGPKQVVQASGASCG
jgi:predicted metal-binding protein